MSFASPRSAYVHVPFCLHRCGYCNFALVTQRDDLIEHYLQAIAVELSALEHRHEVDTLYFGGGTPTYLSPPCLERLCRVALSHFSLATDYEWTVEANPGDLDEQRVEVLASQGVNRISLGAQSFHTAKLRQLERDHDAPAIERAVELARAASMRVSIDLMFAAPGETLDQWLADLAAVATLNPAHVSTYGLTFEKGTEFWNRLAKGEISQQPEELERDMYVAAIEQLSSAGYEHYEISNFAKPREQSRHNHAYWAGDGYFAAGPGAARYVDGVRETNHRSTVQYLKRVLNGESPVAERERLTDEQRAREILIFSLRRIDGVNRNAFSAQSGFSLDALAGDQITQCVDLGLLVDDGKSVRLSRNGLLVSDSLWPDLL